MVNTNLQSGQSKVVDAVACHRFTETLLLELEDQFNEAAKMEGIVIDLTEGGFALPMQHVFAFSSYAAKVLVPLGVLVLLSKSAGIVLEMHQDGISLSIKCFKPADAIFAHWPFLTDLVRSNVPFYEHLQHGANKTSIRSYIIRSIIPVLTQSGRRTRDQTAPKKPVDFILRCVDDFSTIGKICETAQLQGGLSEEKTIGLLKSLESSKNIYPIFSRLDFLVDCYTSQKSFRLGRYFIAAGLMSEGELVGLLERQADLQTSGQKRLLLGQLAIESGYLNERYLNMLLQEQYTFGGHKAQAAKSDAAPTIGQFGDSLFGALGTIDPPGLLQSIASTQKPGLLSVESKRGVILMCFDRGRIVAATLGRLFGIDALSEFLVSWKEGIFLFREDLDVNSLSEAAAIKGNMSKILLDSALLQDNVKTIVEEFPRDLNTVFERVQNFEKLWKAIDIGALKLIDESVLRPTDIAVAVEVAHMIDGLSTVDDIVLQNTAWPSHRSLYLLHALFKNGLITVKDNALFAMLRQVHGLSRGMASIFGPADNHEMLLASLAQTQQRYPLAHSFQVQEDSSISCEMGRLKADGAPVSAILEALKYLISTYLAFGRRLNKDMVDKLIGSQA